jgi:hypothetical protein
MIFQLLLFLMQAACLIHHNNTFDLNILTILEKHINKEPSSCLTPSISHLFHVF